MKPLYPCVLVTGCGGDIAWAIGKILKKERLARRITGCDMSDFHPASALFDSWTVTTRVEHKDYLRRLTALVRKERATLVIPTTENELRLFLKLGLTRIGGAAILKVNDVALKTGLDKLATADFLKKSGLPYPWTRRVADGLPKSYPCVLKKRHGHGGKDMVLTPDRSTASALGKFRPEDIWQEHLPGEDREYTTAVYRTVAGEVRSIALNRKLAGGLTGSARVEHDASIYRLLRSIAESLDLRGGINVQLRLTARGPVTFEINPRFSSTVYFRHLLGFQDLRWSLEESLGKAPGPYRAPLEGTSFFRVSDEVIFRPQNGKESKL